MSTTFLIVLYILLSIVIAIIIHSMFGDQTDSENIFDWPLLLAVMWPLIAICVFGACIEASMIFISKGIRKIYKDRKDVLI